MEILLNNNDVRKYRQLSKQINNDNFNGHVRTIQFNQLSEVLGNALHYDFFNYLANSWTTQSGTFTVDSTTQITAAGIDLSTWSDYAIKINSTVFVIVETATFGGVDTVLTVTGYDLPTTITNLEYKTENNYIKLLNGTAYTYENNTISFEGLRPFLTWHFLTSYLVDGDLKQADVGNKNIIGDLYTNISQNTIKAAKSEYLENAIRSRNNIVQYLDTERSDFEKWIYSGAEKENLLNYNMMVV